MTNLELYCAIQSKINSKYKEKLFEQVKLQNIIFNKMKSDIKIEDFCFFHNENCSENSKPIGSHLFQQNGILTKLANNDHIVVFKNDYTNFDKTAFKLENIKSVIKYPVFCHNHDSGVFQEIENSVTIGKNKEMFLYTLKLLAFEQYHMKYSLLEVEWYLKNLQSEEKQKLLLFNEIDKEEVVENFQSNEIPFIEDYICKIDKVKSKMLEAFYLEKYDQIEFREYISVKKGIAFGCIFFPFEDSNNTFLAVNILPIDEGSRILITFWKNDYDQLCKDNELKDFINGSMHPVLNSLILFFKQNLCYEPKVFLNEDIYCINSLLEHNSFYQESLIPQFFK